MSNTFFPKGAQKLLNAQLDLASDNIKVAMLPNTYTFSVSHEFLSEVGPTVGSAVTLGNKSVVGGVFDADDADFGPTPTGPTVNAVVLYKDTGAANTSPLLAYIDELTGFPFQPNGGSVSVKWSDGAGKIISLMQP